MAEPAATSTPVSERTSSPLVVLESVDKHFGSLQVLKNISLSINRGDVVVVIGPSGSGKSTLCRCINRLETVGSGSIRMGVAHPLHGTGQRRRPTCPRSRSRCSSR